MKVPSEGSIINESGLNIRTLMAYRETAARVWTMPELSQSYPIYPRGTLTYYGLVEENFLYFKNTRRALQPEHRLVVDGLLAALYSGYAHELAFQLVVEATADPGHYKYVADHLELIGHLAKELSEYQAEAASCGKKLDIILRFGSEMNDADGTAAAKDPAEFVRVFRAVRERFAIGCPKALFPFSPALRADLDISAIAQYWPGEDYVDLVGATWYVHGEEQKPLGFSHMADYFSGYRKYNKPMSLDEFGGAEGPPGDYYDNDCMLKPMFGQIEALAGGGIHFEYGTVFLDEIRYGVDARLRFLKGTT